MGRFNGDDDMRSTRSTGPGKPIARKIFPERRIKFEPHRIKVKKVLLVLFDSSIINHHYEIYHNILVPPTNSTTQLQTLEPITLLNTGTLNKV